MLKKWLLAVYLWLSALQLQHFLLIGCLAHVLIVPDERTIKIVNAGTVIIRLSLGFCTLCTWKILTALTISRNVFTCKFNLRKYISIEMKYISSIKLQALSCSIVKVGHTNVCNLLSAYTLLNIINFIIFPQFFFFFFPSNLVAIWVFNLLLLLYKWCKLYVCYFKFMSFSGLHEFQNKPWCWICWWSKEN